MRRCDRERVAFEESRAMDALALRETLRAFPYAEKLHPLRREVQAGWATAHLRDYAALP